jgi:hypothetical protein
MRSSDSRSGYRVLVSVRDVSWDAKNTAGAPFPMCSTRSHLESETILSRLSASDENPEPCKVKWNLGADLAGLWPVPLW